MKLNQITTKYSKIYPNSTQNHFKIHKITPTDPKVHQKIVINIKKQTTERHLVTAKLTAKLYQKTKLSFNNTYYSGVHRKTLEYTTVLVVYVFLKVVVNFLGLPVCVCVPRRCRWPGDVFMLGQEKIYWYITILNIFSDCNNFRYIATILLIFVTFCNKLSFHFKFQVSSVILKFSFSSIDYSLPANPLVKLITLNSTSLTLETVQISPTFPSP